LIVLENQTPATRIAVAIPYPWRDPEIRGEPL